MAFMGCIRKFRSNIVERQPSSVVTLGSDFSCPEMQSSTNEIEETLKRIQSHKGVVGVVVINNEGIPIKSTLDNATTVQYAGLISQLADKACSVVRELDPTNDLTFFRIRTKKHEIMVAPDKEYMLIVVQNQSD